MKNFPSFLRGHCEILKNFYDEMVNPEMDLNFEEFALEVYTEMLLD